jgi:nitronate monooxygenase
VRCSSALPLEGATGEIEALSLWAGQSVALVRRVQTAAEIAVELTSGL